MWTTSKGPCNCVFCRNSWTHRGHKTTVQNIRRHTLEGNEKYLWTTVCNQCGHEEALPQFAVFGQWCNDASWEIFYCEDISEAKEMARLLRSWRTLIRVSIQELKPDEIEEKS